MRFKTEFVITPPAIEARLCAYKSRSEFEMGQLIAGSFSWELSGQCTLAGPASERYTLEIEAFPIDKWIEFKQFLLGNFGYDPGIKQLLHNVIERLESHVNTVTNDQSKTGSQL